MPADAAYALWIRENEGWGPGCRSLVEAQIDLFPQPPRFGVVWVGPRSNADALKAGRVSLAAQWYRYRQPQEDPTGLSADGD